MSALPFLGVDGVPMVNFAAQVVWGNLFGIAVFAGMLIAAVLLRRNPQAHKRLMVLGSIAIVGPAIARVSRWPIFGGEDSGFVPVAFFGLVIVASSVAQQAIAGSKLGRAFVRMLG
jgi:hypothetical protein